MPRSGSAEENAGRSLLNFKFYLDGAVAPDHCRAQTALTEQALVGSSEQTPRPAAWWESGLVPSGAPGAVSIWVKAESVRMLHKSIAYRTG
jgi:hypothetical protein